MPAPYNLARFNFVSVRLAVACAQTGSLTAAARDCIVLAVASRRIRELESAFGDTLFERHSRGLVPTPAGRAFVRHGLVLLREMDDLVAELADIRQGVARHVRLCASTAAINQFLPPLLARYAELHADVRVDVEEEVSELVIVALREGRADIGAFVPGPTHNRQVTDFRTDELVLILPRGHALAGRTPIAFAETLDEQWISLTSGAACCSSSTRRRWPPGASSSCGCRCAASTRRATWWRRGSASRCCRSWPACRSSARAGIPGVEAAGDVGGCHMGHQRGVVAAVIDAETLAHVAVQIECLVEHAGSFTSHPTDASAQ